MRVIITSIAGVFLTLGFMVDVPAMVHGAAIFQGTWLGWGCAGKTLVAVSYSIAGNSATLHQLARNNRITILENTAPASFKVSNGVTTIFSTNKGFKMALHLSSEDKARMVGTIDGVPFKFSHGPKSDLIKFYDGYRDFCK